MPNWQPSHVTGQVVEAEAVVEGKGGLAPIGVVVVRRQGERGKGGQHREDSGEAEAAGEKVLVSKVQAAGRGTVYHT